MRQNQKISLFFNDYLTEQVRCKPYSVILFGRHFAAHCTGRSEPKKDHTNVLISVSRSPGSMSIGAISGIV